MKLNTTRFGQLEVPDETIITLREGILGFPADCRFVLLEHDTEDTPFKWLQSVSNPDLAFVVIDPGELVEGYRFEMEDEVAEELGSQNASDYIPMVIVNIPREDPSRMTANLRGPIVVNAKTRQGRQIVLKEELYPFDYRILNPTEQVSEEEVDREADSERNTAGAEAVN